MRKTLMTLLLVLLPAILLPAEARPERPHWSLELKGGAFFPDAADWSDHYGNSYLGEFGAALSYKVLRQVEIGVEGSYASASGVGQRQGSSGSIRYQQVPLNLFVLARGLFDEEQWLVPYLGGGYTRLFYRQKVAGEDAVEGSVNGYHARGGLQFLLDLLEPGTADDFSREFGMQHSYFFMEGRYLNADADIVTGGSAKIGGKSAMAGFMFEF